MAQPDPDDSSIGASSSPDAADSGARPAHPHRVEDLDDELYGSDVDDLEEEEGDEEETQEWFDAQGRRHVRRAAPEGTEELLEKEAPRETGLPDRMERWRQKSAAGAVVTAFALGLQSALETQRDEPAIVMETSGEPPTDLPVEAQLEQLGPRQSTVRVRRWLLRPGDNLPGSEGEPNEGTPGTAQGGASPGSGPAAAPEGENGSR